MLASLLKDLKNVKVIYSPAARNDRMFQSKQIDCTFPEQKSGSTNESILITSQTISVNNAYVFTNKPYQSLEELNLLPIAKHRGMEFNGVRSRVLAKYIDANDDIQSINLMIKGRVAGVMAYRNDIEGIIKEFNYPDFYFNKALPVNTSSDSIVCYKEKKNIQFINKLNKNLMSLKQSGKLEQMLEQQEGNSD